MKKCVKISVFSLIGVVVVFAVWPSILNMLFPGNTTYTPYRMKESYSGPEDYRILDFFMQSWLREEMRTENRPVDFRGRVVDQHGHPVAGAQVDIYANRIRMNSIGFVRNMCCKFSVNTDEDGSFHVRGFNARCLEVEGIHKDGYLIDDVMADSQRFILPDVAKDSGGRAIFRLWKMASPAFLCMSSNSRVSWRFMHVPMAINIPSEDGEGDGIIYVRLEVEKSPSKDAKDSVNWRLRLDVPGGGVVLTDEAFAFEAPASGYKSFQIREGTIQHYSPYGHGNDIDIKAYVAWGNPVCYSKLVLKIGEIGFSEKDPLKRKCIYAYWIATQPEGSRNLQNN